MAKDEGNCWYLFGVPISETEACRQRRKAEHDRHREQQNRINERAHTDRTGIRNDQQVLSDIAKNYGTGVSPGEASSVAWAQAAGVAAPGVASAVSGAVAAAVDPFSALAPLGSAASSAASSAATTASSALSDPAVAVPIGLGAVALAVYFLLD